MKILIASGIYPPDIGGPAQYARNLYETWKSQGHEVKVAAYRWERAFPPLVRHLLFFTKVIRKGWNADMILVLDTWSAAVPTMYACRLMGKKYLMRVGGDFLWETYTERTGDLVLFKDFYATHLDKLSFKEKMLFKLGGAAMRHAAHVVFSCDWLKSVFQGVYRLDRSKCSIVENHYAAKRPLVEPENRSFVAGSRSLRIKNAEMVKRAFEIARKEVLERGLPDIELDCGKAVYDSFVDKIARSYAVIVASVSDMSPNIISDAVSCGTPYILTRETGLPEEVRAAGILIDPLNERQIVDAIVKMADPAVRRAQAEKVRTIHKEQSWSRIADEIVTIWSRAHVSRR